MSDIAEQLTLAPESAALSDLDFDTYKSVREGKKELDSPAADSSDSPAVDAAGAASAETGAVDTPDAPSAAGEPTRDESGKFTKKAKPRDNPRARIDELTAKQKEAERRAEAAERRARDLEARLRQPPAATSPAQTPAPTAPQDTRPKPALEAFANEPDPYLAWQEALVDWKIEQRDAAIERKAVEARQQERWSAHQKRVETSKAQYPDWETVMHNPALPNLTPVMMEAILDSQRGPDIAYYLGTHPDVFAQLAYESNAAHVSAAPMMRRYLESVLSGPVPAAATATGSAQATRHSRAATPPTPVGNGALTARDESPDSEGYEAYVARRNREDRQRKGLPT